MEEDSPGRGRVVRGVWSRHDQVGQDWLGAEGAAAGGRSTGAGVAGVYKTLDGAK